MSDYHLNLSECVAYLAMALKSLVVCKALGEVRRKVRESGARNVGVPLHFRNALIKLMKEFGYREGYVDTPEDLEVSKFQSYLSPNVQGRRFLQWPSRQKRRRISIEGHFRKFLLPVWLSEPRTVQGSDIFILENLSSASSRLGGWTPIKNMGDPHITDIVEFAVSDHNKEANSKLRLSRVVKGENQVVSGVKYKLFIEAKDYGGKVGSYEVVVLERAWEKFMKLVSFKPVKV